MGRAVSYGTCNRCQADIVWALTVIQPGAKGGGRKRMPLDPGRAPDDSTYANVAVSRDHLGSLYARVLSKAEPDLREGEHKAVPHFATCPNRPAKPVAPAASAGAAPGRLTGNVVPFRRRAGHR